MPEDKVVDPHQIEERGVAADGVVVASGGGSAAGAYVGGTLSGQGGPSDHLPPPPKIELPPGVDRD